MSAIVEVDVERAPSAGRAVPARDARVEPKNVPARAPRTAPADAPAAKPAGSAGAPDARAAAPTAPAAKPAASPGAAAAAKVPPPEESESDEYWAPEVENALLKDKLRQMMLGLPWRLYVSLRNMNLAYLRKDQARKLYEKSIDKIERRARANPTAARMSLGTDAGEHNPYKHPLLKKTYDLNGSLYKARDQEFQWIAKAIEISLQSESYEIGRGLAELAMENDRQLSAGERAALFIPIASILIACGETDAVKRLLVRWASCLPRNSDAMASLKMTLFPDALTGDRSALVLPSGKLNALRMATAIEQRRLSADQATDFYIERQDLFTNNAQNYLCLFNAWRKVDLDVATTFFNKFAENYGVPEVEIPEVGENILANMRFATRAPVENGPLVSIVMGAFGAASTARYAVRSLLEQSYRNIEVLIADDCSQDDTAAVLAEVAGDDPRVQLYRSVENQGVYNVRNALIARAKGEFITFHDADDIALPHRIESQFRAVVGTGKPVCVGRGIRMHADGRVVFFRDQAALRMSVVSLFAHREVFKRLGAYRSAKFGADTEYLERAKEVLGPDAVENMKTPLNVSLWSESSLTRTDGIEALEDGFRAVPRRRYAQSAFLQRLLGKEVMRDEDVDGVLEQSGSLRKASDVQPLARTQA